MMAYFLDQENAAAWTAVQDLANANGSKADKKLRRWVVEVQRTAVDQWVVHTKTLAGDQNPVLALNLVCSTSCMYASLTVLQKRSRSNGWTARLCDHHQSIYLIVVCSLFNFSLVSCSKAITFMHLLFRPENNPLNVALLTFLTSNPHRKATKSCPRPPPSTETASSMARKTADWILPRRLSSA